MMTLCLLRFLIVKLLETNDVIIPLVYFSQGDQRRNLYCWAYQYSQLLHLSSTYKTSCKMGAEQSNIIPMPIGFDFTTMTFRGTDQIRLTYPTQQDISTTREVIMEFWPKGSSFTYIAFIFNEEVICPLYVSNIAFVIDEEITCMLLLHVLRLSIEITISAKNQRMWGNRVHSSP